MPFHILAIHICTCAQSLRTADAVACVAGRRGWERRSRPGKADEDSVLHKDFEHGKRVERRRKGGVTYLARSRSSTGGRARCAIPRGAVRSSRQAMGVSRVLLRPVLSIGWGRVTLVMVHLVRLGRVGRVGRISWARGRNVGIYRHFGIRLDVLRMMMVVLLSILQGH